MGIGGVLAGLRRRLRPERIEVDVDVVEQLVLGHLIRFDTSLAQDLRDYVLEYRHTANAQQVRLSLIRLQSLRLIDRVPDEGDSEETATGSPWGQRWRITRDGKRLRVVIAAQPRSAIRTHV